MVLSAPFKEEAVGARVAPPATIVRPRRKRRRSRRCSASTATPPPSKRKPQAPALRSGRHHTATSITSGTVRRACPQRRSARRCRHPLASLAKGAGQNGVPSATSDDGETAAVALEPRHGLLTPQALLVTRSVGVSGGAAAEVQAQERARRRSHCRSHLGATQGPQEILHGGAATNLLSMPMGTRSACCLCNLAKLISLMREGAFLAGQ